MIFVFAKGLMY